MTEGSRDELEGLRQAVARFASAQMTEGPYLTALDGFAILRSDHGTPPSHRLLTPALCLVVQGAKWTMFGDRRFDYRAGQALVVSVEIPSLSQIVAASPGEPYLAVAIVFDLTTMREVLESLDTPPKVDGDVCQGVFVIDIGSQLAACVLRMIRLLDTPQAIGALYPLLMRELCYWLLTGPHGSDIAKMTVASSHTQRVISAVHNLRERFAEPVRVEELATSARLSPSAFHRQFKALTSMTPLQYQKQFRLLEARRLMLSSAMNAETASYKVGYESPSQFSREYSRMFGLAPGRDVAAFRSQVA